MLGVFLRGPLGAKVPGLCLAVLPVAWGLRAQQPPPWDEAGVEGLGFRV